MLLFLIYSSLLYFDILREPKLSFHWQFLLRFKWTESKLTKQERFLQIRQSCSFIYCALYVCDVCIVCLCDDRLLINYLNCVICWDTECLMCFLMVNFAASLGVITNPVGAIISGVLMEWLGRKRAVQLVSLPFLIGWIMIALSQDMVTLCIGRAITGVAIG